MKVVYCSNCGMRLAILRKALPKYATIIDVVEFHKCLATPAEIDLTPVDIPKFTMTSGKNKFVQKLNELNPGSDSTFGGISTASLRDRRFETSDEKAKSTAPPSILNLVKDMDNSTPERILDEPESET